jgi:hypothetical protein
MHRCPLAAVLFALALSLPAEAGAAAASALIGHAVQDLGGRSAGRVEDLIVDVSAARVRYVVHPGGVAGRQPADRA